MEKKINFRARVMKYAWQLWRATKQQWRICMIKAWQLYHEKADGTIRKAMGTLKNLPVGATLGGKKVTKPSYKTMAYFDTEKNSFRCFKIENLICTI